MTETQRGARIYSAGTAEGFARMRRAGIPEPPFNVEDAFAQLLAGQYRAMFDGLVGEVTRAAVSEGFTARRTDEGVTVDADPLALTRRLAELMGLRGPDVARLRVRLNARLVSAERRFFQDMLADADPRTVLSLRSMSIPKREVFADRIEGMRALYLDQAVQRIAGEQDDLKRRFLRKLVDWAEGKTDRLYVSRLVQEMEQTSARQAKFFARDQFSRFNRSLMIETYRQAEAPYVEPIDVGDGRVRPTHRDWSHRIFTVDALLRDPRWKDYNCRCGFVPHYDLTAAGRRRLIA